ncbi:MAG: PEP-CTERM sorting domain-containing protein [Burkholderiales bacterium]|nr:PEP-CTERM sorting domain-containing protein [Phycisphaerae bacterium]
MKCSILVPCGAILAIGLTTSVHAAVITPGNLLVAQVGDGSGALSSAATPAFLKEFSSVPSSAVVQTVAIPTSGGFRSTNAGTSTSELLITFNDGHVSVAGYDAAAGTAGIVATTSTTAPRRVLGYDIFADLATGPAIGATTTSFSTNNIRSSVVVNGNLYAGGSNTGQVLITAGGSGAGTVISTTVTNTRFVQDFNDNLYFSTGSGTTRGVYQFSGEPTTTGNTSTVMINLGGSASPYGFWLNATNDLAYIADDRTTTGGGIQKWTKTAGVWSLAYTISTDYDAAGSAPTGAHGLAVDITGTNPLLYFTTTDGSRLGAITDSGTQAAAEASLTVLQVAPTNTAFRSVVIPEPGILGLMGLAGLLGLRRRR